MISLFKSPPYHRVQLTSRGRVRRTFGSMLPDIDGGFILDLGCCVGQTTEEISELYPDSRIIGIDISPRVIEESKKRRGDLTFLAADGYLPPFAPETFDIIFAMNNIGYAYEKDPKRLLPVIPKIGRILKNKGCLVVSIGERYAGYYKDKVAKKIFSMNVIHNPIYPGRGYVACFLDIEEVLNRKREL